METKLSLHFQGCLELKELVLCELLCDILFGVDHTIELTVSEDRTVVTLAGEKNQLELFADTFFEARWEQDPEFERKFKDAIEAKTRNFNLAQGL